MGLSSSPKETFNTYQVLIDIAKSLKDLQSDPDALQKMANDAYALPEIESAKAKNAREDIAKYQAIVDEQKDRQIQIDKDLQFINAKRNQIDSDLAKFQDEKSALNIRSSELDDMATILSKKEKYLSQLQQDIQNGKEKLAADNLALDERKNQIDEYETSLKEKAAKLKDLTSNM